MPGHAWPILPPVDTGRARPYLALNMISTLDGRAAVNGTAAGIGSDADKRLMRELRAEADVVLHGAGTVRADPLSARVPPDLVEQRLAHGLSAQPVGAIVTRSGRLPAEHPYYQSATRIYVLADEGVDVAVDVQRPTVTIVRAGSIGAVIDDLAALGARRILSEGGPTLNAALFAGGLVDELFLTLAPKIVGGADPLTLVRGGTFPMVRLELRQIENLHGELFLRYGVLPPMIPA